MHTVIKEIDRCGGCWLGGHGWRGLRADLLTNRFITINLPFIVASR